MPSTSQLITDFSNLSNQKWQIVNDDVMGGLSHSQLQINVDGNGVFLGTISLENNGGFASVKNNEPLNLEGFTAIKLDVKGDGKKYHFRLQTGTNHELHSWNYDQHFFTKKDLWMEVHLPLQNFTATYRGNTLSDATPLDPSSIRRFGFLISDQQQGDFRLEIGKIAAI